MKKDKKIIDYIWIVILSICSVAWMYPIFMILINSFKEETAITTSSVFQILLALIIILMRLGQKDFYRV